MSGGCLNPVVGLVQVPFMALYDRLIYIKVEPKVTLAFMAPYIFAPAVGGLMAGLFSRFVHEKAIYMPDRDLPKK